MGVPSMKQYEQQMVQEAYVQYSPTKATIEIKPDNEQAAKVIAHIPDWFFYSSLLIGSLMIAAMVIRFTPLGKYVKLFIKVWKQVAFGEKK